MDIGLLVNTLIRKTQKATLLSDLDYVVLGTKDRVFGFALVGDGINTT